MAIKKYVGDRFVGLSTDTKPTTATDGSIYFETNTKSIYILIGGS